MPINKEHERYLKKQENKRILPKIEKGIGTAKLNNILTSTPAQIRQHTKNVLKPLIKDEQILNIISEEQNAQKLLHRFDHHIEFLNQNNLLIAETGKMGGTPQQTINKIKKMKLQGVKTDPKKPYETRIAKILALEGFGKPKQHIESTIQKINIITTFRKGK